MGETDTEPLLDSTTIGEEPEKWLDTDAIRHDVVSPDNASSPSNPATGPGKRAYVATFILFLVNLLNYMDRYEVAANLTDIQKTFGIENDNSLGGLIQTIFVVGYMVTSPLFGFLGDRYSRKIIMSVGIIFWAAMTLACSFVPANMLWLFILIRGLVGVGEASYSTISCTIIGDLFVGNRRTKMLMLFYFAIPVGSGLGYIIGKGIADAFDDWRWAFRFTPALGVISVIAIMLIIKEPKRGQAETGNKTLVTQSYLEDLKALTKNKTYILSTLGSTSIAWVVGGLGLWLVKLVELAYEINGIPNSQVSFIFGFVTCASGFCGVLFGTMGAQYYRRYNPRADALVCAMGNLLSSPFLFVGLLFCSDNVYLAWVCLFVGETFLFLNWALVPDILMYVLIPVRRSSGNGMQLLSSHLLGDALSPYILGAVSDAFRGSGTTTMDRYTSLSYSLVITAFVAVIGGGFFLFSALYIEQDKQNMQTLLKSCENRKSISESLADPVSSITTSNDFCSPNRTDVLI